jgi:hypothetical protein
MAILILLITGIVIYLLVVLLPPGRKRGEWQEDRNSHRQIDQRWPEERRDDQGRE